MNNFEFINSFIIATKLDKLDWQSLKNSVIDRKISQIVDNVEQGFFVQRRNNYIVILKIKLLDNYGNNTAHKYSVIILSRYNEVLFCINDENLFDDNDGSSITHSSEDEFVLSRLFRLAERNAKKIDKLLKELTDDLGILSDDLPF